MLIRPRLLLLFSITTVLPALAVDWQPINPADLAMKVSKNDPNADAEALFREVRVSSEQHGASYAKNTVSEYIRLKVFTERGKEFANVQVPYFRETNVYNVFGRTIHPDGSIVELSKDSIFEKVLEKRGAKTKVMTFALPAVEPGSIIEYKFTKDEGETVYRYRELEVQSSFPVDEVTFLIKPLGVSAGYAPTMRYIPFGCVPERGQVTRENFDVFKVKNVPAYHDEPYSPPEYNAKKWILIYYEENSKTKNDKFWSALGRDRYKEYSEQVKVNGDIKTLAAQLTAGATTDDAKLDKLLAYCRTEIKDVRGDTITTAEVEKAKANHNTADTIRRKEGDRVDINMAFLALAQGAGFDARRADISDRATFILVPEAQSAFFLNTFAIAVSVGGKWKFFDVTNPAVPGGQLRWQEQGVYALVTDNKEPEMMLTPLLGPKESVKNRFASLKISDDGTLEGDVREILFGNEASAWREENKHTNDTQREEDVRKELKSRFADFEVTNIRVIANPDATKPVGINYHLVVRSYAQRTGKRLFVEPNFFAARYGSRFPEATRKNNIYFEYPWGEVDSVDVTLPAGFVLDHADAPGGINIANTCDYAVKIGYDKEHNQIQYRRHLFFGNNDNLLLFEAKIYPTLKKVFDSVHDSDNHILTFKSDAPVAGLSQ